MKLYSIGFFLVTSIFTICLKATAQIIPDNTLPDVSNVVVEDNNINLSGGTRRGGNLFHSFQEFNLNAGQTAIFVNQDPSVIRIFSRVTGNGISSINGGLLSPSTADLFLINQNGFIFGRGLSTNINGSLFLTTASSLVFEDGDFLDSNPSSLNLKRLIFNRSGDIDINGIGHNIRFIDPTNPLASLFTGLGESTNGIRGAFGQKVVVLANNIRLDGGVITSPSGDLVVGSIENGVVDIDLSGPAIFDFSNVTNFGDIELTNFSLLDTSGVLSSDLILHSNNLTISNASALFNANFGSNITDVGVIDINAQQDIRISTLENTNVFFRFLDEAINVSGGIYSQNYSSGLSSNIDIETRNLLLDSFSVISSNSFGPGQGGDIRIHASDTITLKSEPVLLDLIGSSFTSSSILSNSFDGQSGDISVMTGDLNILGGSVLSSQVFGFTDGSDIMVDVANDLNIAGSLLIDPSTNSIIGSSLATLSVGGSNAGSLFINAKNVNLLDGGQIISQPGVTGDSGSIFLNANSLNISGSSQNISDAPSSANSGIRAAAFLLNPSLVNIFDILPIPQGNTGIININVQQINISDTGTISVANEGAGDGGVIDINSLITTLDTGGSITSQTLAGNGGNISIDSDVLILNDSSISANSNNSSGGNIDITSIAFFSGPDSIISASSAIAPQLDGDVTIATPITDLGRSTRVEQGTISFTPLSDLCQEIADTGSSLINEGAGETQADKIDYTTALLNWHRGSTSGAAIYEHPVTGKLTTYTRSVGWIVHPDGKVSLVSAPTETIQYEAGELPCSVASEQPANLTSSKSDTPYLVAQNPPNIRDIRPDPLHQQQIEQREDIPAVEITPPAELTTPRKRLSPVAMKVGKFIIEGNTVVSTDEINALLEPFIDHSITAIDLRNIERKITSLYVKRGYITSIAILDESRNQFRDPINDGIVLTIIEGTISDVKISGTKRLESFVRNRIAPGHAGVFNQNELQKVLRLLLLDVRVNALNVGISPSNHLDKSVLNVDIDPGSEIKLSVSYDNNRSPSVGTQQRSIKLSHLNLVGQGDTLQLGYRNTDGSNTIQAQYRYPVNAKNGTVDAFYQYSSSNIIERPFDILDISGESHLAQLGYRQPIIRRATPNIVQELALGATISYENSRLSSPLIPFSISAGADDNGRTQIAALRLSQDYYQQQDSSYLATRSQFSIGLGGTNVSSPGSNFFAWRGQAIWARQLPHNLLFIARGDLQFADGSLLPSEQFALGGHSSVRGFRPATLLNDNGILGSISVLVPVYNGSAGSLSIYPFVDTGTSWSNSNNISSDSQTIASAGVGVKYKLGDRLDASLEWGIPLTGRPSQTRTPQEDGVHFSLTWNVF